ncbi:MAG: hypothetical protein CME33_19670 [Gimesia sp.]|uniref:hypothetical protein n=1 Tax=Gimesia sp. TaxID=2024833 RepID=UPI000C65BE32|nr:hypothetical protein [Gimesia sp.]MAX38782.1 hypothetical protein [Gimesia sp.]|tara:strand:+ start:349 stop:585 length:237 start_codon:yes stop_codon:yes gene_type:complete
MYGIFECDIPYAEIDAKLLPAISDCGGRIIHREYAYRENGSDLPKTITIQRELKHESEKESSVDPEIIKLLLEMDFKE